MKFLLLLTFFTFSHLYAEVHCRVNGETIAFSKAYNPNQPDPSLGIRHLVYAIHEGLYLDYCVNINYGIGGKVKLVNNSREFLLLRFLNDFEEDILEAKITYDDFFIECSYRE